jgi:hypothetical protein
VSSRWMLQNLPRLRSESVSTVDVTELASLSFASFSLYMRLTTEAFSYFDAVRVEFSSNEIFSSTCLAA